ncbi:PepSY domain-containing protein [Fictibacillus fluitans]|uniref:PepSY domain-containing protein n=1 Tax=Fictibacillus fluitans TaxID=3058422 RepID=A0ABT8HY75_9BACL|nr:PepSY domain-containing protein [Fictibacillus sp. NE201]MDN4525733.1 PepSY domain-containing protein [Fictibacillus sp. NE201]
MTPKKSWLIGIAVLVILAGAGIGYYMNVREKNQTLSQLQAEELVTATYDGDVKRTQLVNEKYFDILFDGAKGQYTIHADAKTGNILSVKKINNKRGKKDDTEPRGDPSAKLTEQEARTIAAKEVKGEVDDVELKGEGSDQVYEVEVNTKTKEAKVYVNVYTGKVSSIVWDNDND